ncbi:hypothetical protein FOL47_002701 [Perkinsus chesapeaki]|uniref:Uncharacterized protein n=1 Tax=Perkinsus chesapeaki TaxID=330153 RepID=A0A7J6MC20_PERCH|nr:hypothetical protein FOL47_002701 [Perkinsus chesapeaki]
MVTSIFAAKDVPNELEELVSSLRARQASKYTSRRNGSADVVNKGGRSSGASKSQGNVKDGLSEILSVLDRVVAGRSD